MQKKLFALPSTLIRGSLTFKKESAQIPVFFFACLSTFFICWNVFSLAVGCHGHLGIFG
jgi:hypothetical protein